MAPRAASRPETRGRGKHKSIIDTRCEAESILSLIEGLRAPPYPYPEKLE